MVSHNTCGPIYSRASVNSPLKRHLCIVLRIQAEPRSIQGDPEKGDPNGASPSLEKKAPDKPEGDFIGVFL